MKLVSTFDGREGILGMGGTVHRPCVTLSWAQTLDGRLATVTGDSQWIGGPESLQLAHELRRDHQAILVGINTVLKDNPRLTCRIPGGRNPIRVVLDSQFRLPLDSTLATSLAEAPTWVYGSIAEPEDRKSALAQQGVRAVSIAGDQGRLSLDALLEDLWAMGIQTLFVEGGASVLTAFLAAGLADRVVVVTAPFLLGRGVEAIGDLGHTVLAQVPRPQVWKKWELGDDTVTELILHR